MAMDFFAAQDAARKRSRKLVALFIAAVVCMILVLYAVVMVLWFTGSGSGDIAQAAGTSIQQPASWWNPGVFATVAGLTILVVSVASLGKIASLRAGGGAVARSMGGRQVAPDTNDPDERKLMNVVEEMALASGVTVPEVYVLDDEEGINAFAAGFSVDDAAVAVTRGCIRQLSRDELQGVIAHEFAHILNGDMRLNIRLIGVLFGILVLAVVGRGLMRTAFYSGGGRRSDKGGGGAAAIILLGITLVLVGYLGVFFGRLIQSAVSRQREYLADSAAVQFTRNPAGIAGALRKIGQAGSRIRNEHAVDAAHMFFASGLKSAFGGMFATHPPLRQRILAIDPSWDGSFEAPQRKSSAAGRGKAAAGEKPAKAARTGPSISSPHAMIAQIGLIGAAQLSHACQLRQSLDQRFGEAIHQPLQARSLVFALLVDDQDASLRSRQIDFLRQDAGPELAQAVEAWHTRIGDLTPAERLPMIELALPALHALSDQQRQDFIRRIEWIVKADTRVTLFDFAVTWLVRAQLLNKALKDHTPRPPVAQAAALAKPLSTLIGALVLLSSDEDKARLRFEEALAGSKSFAGLTRFPGSSELGFDALDRALEQMASATFALRREILEAACQAVYSDGRVSVSEAELMRVVAAALQCPMPPLVADTDG